MKGKGLIGYLIQDVEEGLYDEVGYKRQYPPKHIFDENLSNKANKELLKEKNKDIDFFNKELGKRQAKNQKNFYMRLTAIVQDSLGLNTVEESEDFISKIISKMDGNTYVLDKETRRYETKDGKLRLISAIEEELDKK